MFKVNTAGGWNTNALTKFGRALKQLHQMPITQSEDLTKLRHTITQIKLQLVVGRVDTDYIIFTSLTLFYFAHLTSLEY